MDFEQNVQKTGRSSNRKTELPMTTPTILHIQRRKLDSSAQRQGAGLIMSATLVPPVAAVARADPEERLNDYLDALRFYLSLPDTVIDRILFVDNSNGDLSPLAELVQRFPHGKDVELISFEGNDHPYQRGKAYGEFKLMDYGLANTTLFGANDIVWKTTGRLKFLNLPEMTARCNRLPFDILCDLHNVPWIGSGKWRNHENMDLRVFAFRMRAYDAILRDLWHSREVGFDAEFFYHWMLKEHPGFRVVPRFPLQAQLQGISGRHQRDYRSHSQRTKDAVRSAVRRITPWLWL
jgi:hypothetical protein